MLKVLRIIVKSFLNGMEEYDIWLQDEISAAIKAEDWDRLILLSQLLNEQLGIKGGA